MGGVQEGEGAMSSSPSKFLELRALRRDGGARGYYSQAERRAAVDKASELGFSAKELARALNLSPLTVSRWWRTSKPRTIARPAQNLELSLAAIRSIVLGLDGGAS